MAANGIKAIERFVEKKVVGIVHQGLREAEPLPHTLGIRTYFESFASAMPAILRIFREIHHLVSYVGKSSAQKRRNSIPVIRS